MSAGSGDSATGSFLDRTVRDLLADVAARTSAPGGGATAAVAVALAAALVEMAARYADDDAAGAAAANLRARAEPLADRDAEAYAAYLGARRDRRTGQGDDASVEAAAVAATAVPVELAELGAAVATLGAELVADGNPQLRGDAMAGVQLAAAAAATAAGLARENVGPEHALAVRAAAAEATARTALGG